jgi:tRNA(Ile)-lysidine synthase
LKIIDVDIFVSKWKHLKDRKLYIACSGGVDSVVLFHLLRLVTDNICLLHVNYKLRGEESELDCVFVHQLAKKYSIPVFIKEIDTNAYLQEHGGNLQEVARDIRYRFFEEYLIRDKDSLLLLGHHADDQIETFFQHLARKSGILGMSCMLENDSKIIRPLLTYSKEAIYSLAKKNKWEWREDLSNCTNKYSRNKLRNEFIPKISQAIPTLKESIMYLISTFQENQQELEYKVRPIYNTFKQSQRLYLEDFDKMKREERVCFFQMSSLPIYVVLEVEKLRKSQKGKAVHFQELEIVRETDYFQFLTRKEIDVLPSLLITEVDSVPTQFSSDILYIDHAKLKGELKLRLWEVGDRMSLVGMKGSKLISDILTGAKVTSSQRKSQLVLVDDEKIIWCVGLRVSRLIQITDTTEKILQVCLQD